MFSQELFGKVSSMVMSMGSDRTLSAEELAEVVSTLVNVAERQQYVCEELLDQLKTALNAFESRTTELTRDMPNEIAQRAAQKVLEGIDASVTRSVTDVLRPVETKAQTLLGAMEEPVAMYRRVAQHWVVRYPVSTIIFVACLSGLVSAVLVVLAMMIGIV
jgi:hypothetical protein